MSCGNIQRLARFSASGVLSTGIHSGVAVFAILNASLSPPLANAIAFCVATVFSYWLNTAWSFSKQSSSAFFLRFWAVCMVGLVITTGIAWAADHAGLPYWTGIVLVVLAVPPITFFLHLKWTYRD